MICGECPFLKSSGSACPGSPDCDPPAHALLPGTVLHDRYAVGRVLGEGGFGITYYGQDLTLESPVAIKEYFPPDRASRVSSGTMSLRGYSGASGPLFESGKERFLQEARMMAKIKRTPNIVGVRDYFEANNTAYIVMDYLGGVTLRALMEKHGGKIPARELLPLIRPLFPALAAMHAGGLIHRDINPENLMLDGGNICLLDFGCARENVEDSATMTVTLRHGFAPIEQYQPSGGGQGPWTDVYALAATVYYCLTGTQPVHAMDRLLDDRLVPPNKLGAGLTEGQERALMRALAVRPNRRTRSVKELEEGLYGGRKRSGWARWAAAFAAVTAAAAILIGLYALWKPPKDTGDAPVSPSENGPSEDTDLPPSGQGAGTDNDTPIEDDLEGMFDDAAEVSVQNLLEGGTDNDLRKLMADDSVKSVVIPSGVTVDMHPMGGPLHITKPLKVSRGATFAFELCVWVESTLYVEEQGQIPRGVVTVSGGRLLLDGTFTGRLVTERGGTVSVSPGAVMNAGMIWLENRSNLQAPAGKVDFTYNFNTCLDGGEELSGPVRVTDFASLREAAGGTRPVEVAADITLEHGLLISAPLIVDSGSRLTVPEECELVCGGKLRVDGEIDGGVSLGRDTVCYNYGVMTLAPGPEDSAGARIMNAGHITLTQGGYRYLNFFSTGTVDVDTPAGTEARITDSSFWTLGSLDVLSASRLAVDGTTYMNLGGKTTIHPDGVIENGAFTGAGGVVTMYGDLVNVDGRAVGIDTGAGLYSFGGKIRGGLVIEDAFTRGLFPDAFGGDCAFLEMAVSGGEELYVSTAEELIAALETYTGGPVVLCGEAEIDKLTVTGTLTVSSGGVLKVKELTVDGGCLRTYSQGTDSEGRVEVTRLFVKNSGHMELYGGTVTFTGDGGLVLEDSDVRIIAPCVISMNGSILSLDSGSALANLGTIADCGGVTVSGGSYLFDNGLLPISPGADVTVTEDSVFSPNPLSK